MQTTKWGPGLWTALHCMTYNYPENPSKTDKNNYKVYFTMLGDMLPCIYCRNSYKTYIKHLPIELFMNDRKGLTYWLFTLHNLVNKKIGKPIISFKECCKIYEGMRAKCGKVMDNAIEYESCVRQVGNVTDDQVRDFVITTECKYETIANKCINNLNNDPDNPNKEACLCRYKLNKYKS